MDRFATHLPVLERAIRDFGIETVLEFGTGLYSTPLLVQLCKEVISVEMHERSWFDKNRTELASPNFTPLLMLGPEVGVEYLLNADRRFDMIFVDGHEDSRWKVVNAAFDKTDVIIAHDTEVRYYQWHRIELPDGWIWLDFKKHIPWTSVFVPKGWRADLLTEWR